MEGFQPSLLEVREKDSGHSMIMEVYNGSFTPKPDKNNDTFTSRTHYLQRINM